MGRARTFDTEDAIKIATRLFWRGYDRTSMSELTDALGIGAASFYFAFGSKEALFRTVVERYIAALDKAFERAFRTRSPAHAVEALLRSYADVVTDPRHIAGCLVINNSPSIHADDDLQRWLAEHRRLLRQRLEKRFAADIASGKLPKRSSAETIARFVATLAGGIAVEAQSGATREELYGMIELALRNLSSMKSASRLPTPRSPSI